ncbi:hypothetical protein DWW79_09995 [Alistipes sp. AF17-16]|nr:hypothetical protein DW082_03040 [Alistipes sp. AF48-12]RHR62053.1 hypothetical protein DWW79_09995 [Alistipes sp. AF17-16]
MFDCVISEKYPIFDTGSRPEYVALRYEKETIVREANADGVFKDEIDEPDGLRHGDVFRAGQKVITI